MDQHRPNKVLAPWPWICGINPGADGKTWYKNTEVTRPGSLSLSEFVFEQHEFSQVCTSAPDPANPSNLRFDCHTERIPVPPPGVFAFSRDCHGHSRYNYQAADGTLCLKIPEIIPGNGVMLAGLNFFSRNAKVHLRRLDGSFPNIVLDCGVNGDRTTPLVDKGIVVANCQRVTDLVTFTIPEKVGAGINARPLPPGRYSITVVVPNDVGYAPVAGTVPSEFVSNDVWIEILPNPTQTYRLWTDEAFCYEETDGPGSDEPWFQAYIAQFIPGGSSLVTMFPQRQVTIMRTVDVDSGEPITFSAPDLFRGRFQPGEIFAATIVGLEVDSEDAADQQIKAFGDAYALYWEHFITQLAVQSDVSIVLQLITKGVATGTSLALGAGILGGIAVVGILYALWAGADPIGYDMMALNGMVSFDLTNPTIPLPATSEKSFGSLSLSVQPESKKPQAGGTHAKYSESHIYRSEDEDSTYKLVYRVERV